MSNNTNTIDDVDDDTLKAFTPVELRLMAIVRGGAETVAPYEARSVLSYARRARNALFVAQAKLTDHQRRAKDAARRHEAELEAHSAREQQLRDQVVAAQRAAADAMASQSAELGREAISLLTRIELWWDESGDPVSFGALMAELGELLSRRKKGKER
jgi:hypothetical protein